MKVAQKLFHFGGLIRHASLGIGFDVDSEAN